MKRQLPLLFLCFTIVFAVLAVLTFNKSKISDFKTTKNNSRLKKVTVSNHTLDHNYKGPIVAVKLKTGEKMNTFMLQKNHRSWSEVSLEIFGNTKQSKKLEAWNSYLSPKNLKNIYYPSPSRTQYTEIMINKSVESKLVALK